MKPDKQAVFKYIPHPKMGHAVFLPLLDVVISHRKSLPIRAFVDSGATGNFLPRIYAHRIGLLDDDNKVPSFDVKGISGVITSKEHMIKSIEIRQNNQTFDVFYNPKVLVPSTDDSQLDFMILGRDMLFKKYDVTFSEKRRKMVLAKN